MYLYKPLRRESLSHNAKRYRSWYRLITPIPKPLFPPKTPLTQQPVLLFPPEHTPPLSLTTPLQPQSQSLFPPLPGTSPHHLYSEHSNPLIPTKPPNPVPSSLSTIPAPAPQTLPCPWIHVSRKWHLRTGRAERRAQRICCADTMR
jgi:hypothetical protein